jgi:type IV pilus assembly protein PilW
MKNYRIRAASEDKGCEGHRFSSGKGGFSLVELMIAMAVGLVVLAGVYTVFVLQNKTFSTQEDVVEMQQSVRAGIDIMAREIGMAGYDPRRVNSNASTTDDFSGVAVSSSQLQIRTDLNGDGAINASSEENIIYAYNATDKQITRNSGSGNQPFIENVDSFTFQYLDGSGAATASAAQVRRIRITITGRTAKADPNYPNNGGYRTYTLTEVVSPRNLDYIYN